MTARAHPIALGALVVVAVAASLLPVWTPLRVLIVLPVLVLVAGRSATGLVLGSRPVLAETGTLHDDRTAVAGSDDDGSDGVLRLLLPTLLGIVCLLVAVLALALLRLPLGPRTVPIATGTIALVLLLIAQAWRARAGSPATALGSGCVTATARPTRPGPAGRLARLAPLWTPSTYRTRIRPVLGAGVAVLLLAGVLTGALELQPALLARSPLGGRTVPAVVGVAALVLLLRTGPRRRRSLAGELTTGDAAERTAAPAPYRHRLQPALGVAVAGLVIAAGTAAAVAIQPTVVERYTQLAIVGQGPKDGTVLTARPGTRVRLAWTLSSYGFRLSDPAPAVTVQVGDRSAHGLTVQQSDPAAGDHGSGSTSRQIGHASFLSPPQPGLYRIQLTVADNRTPDTAPSLSTLVLKVTS